MGTDDEAAEDAEEERVASRAASLAAEEGETVEDAGR